MAPQLWLYPGIGVKYKLSDVITVIQGKHTGIEIMSRIVSDLRYIREVELMRLGYTPDKNVCRVGKVIKDNFWVSGMNNCIGIFYHE